MKTNTKKTEQQPALLMTVPSYDESRELRLQELQTKEAELRALRLQFDTDFPTVKTIKAPLNIGVGKFIKDLILEGYKNVDILKQVETKYSNNNTTYSCVAWYRNDMKKKGLI